MRVFIVGFGVVGRALAQLLRDRGRTLYEGHALSPRIVGVVDRGGAAVSERGIDATELLGVKEASGTVAKVAGHGVPGRDTPTLIADSDADVVIEAAPSTIDDPTPAINNIKAAFRTGKHVVAVNKAPLAVAMPALMELSEYNRVQFRFSGTVGGGTPMLATALESARGDDVLRIRGILNGTTNYILSTMHETGRAFDDVLAEATDLGYAETDPSSDIDGIDAATKVVILANLVLNRRATLRDVKIEGIRGLSRDRIDAAADRGNVLKLIGDLSDELSVVPQEVPKGDPLDVPANLNAITLTLRASGDITLIGRGAGGVETATAVLRDMLDIWKTVGDHA